VEIYVNGFSTSLPEDVQYNALRKIPGFENVKMFRPGYAIEYDYFPPTQLELTLETRLIQNLYFAGQINGTTGYEEAACQGLVAGINAHNKIHEKDPFVLKRSEAYIGVLIDDLINKGTEEPYRMFTSRAEYRLLLRQDNADLRLTEKGYNLGWLDGTVREDAAQEKADGPIAKRPEAKETLAEAVNLNLVEMDTAPVKEKVTVAALLKRPEISIHNLPALDGELAAYLAQYDDEILEQAEIAVKYESYIEKEEKNGGTDARTGELPDFAKLRLRPANCHVERRPG
jgi:tRNA uridine 5-carboxymethylaminomethyl modification enzyme